MALKTTGIGYTRFNVAEVARSLRVDSRASWLGKQIRDAFVNQLCEQAAKLTKVSMAGARDVLIACDVSRVFIWKAKLAKDGDTYERESETNEVTRGSLALLRKHYGTNNVAVTDENGAKKICAAKKADKGTLAFYGLSHLAKEEKAESDKSADKGGKGNGKNGKGAKDKGKTATKARKTVKKSDDDEGDDE